LNNRTFVQYDPVARSQSAMVSNAAPLGGQKLS